MNRWLAAGAGAGLLFATAASADDDTVSKWVSERAREHGAFLAPETRIPADALFRERGPGQGALPDFVPPKSLAPLIRAVRTGVVNISTVNADAVPGASARSARQSLGSGFIISTDGYVVTNNHVVAQARQIRVNLTDGRKFFADIVGRDPSTDVALLKLRGDVGELPFTYLGDSDALEVGDWVLAIGTPFGLDHSVSHGMISAKERVLGIGVFDDFIQTDALINPGNSGGPLFNMSGEVVGVNTAIVSQGQGIGFAVPINMVKDLLPNLRVNGRLARGWLGVTIREGGNGAGQPGAVVREVFTGSPAAQAGIKEGDRVIAVNGRTIETYLQLLRRVAILAPGSEARLTLQRPEGPVDVNVRLAERPAPETLQALNSPGNAERIGVIVRDVTGPVAATLGLTPMSGVLVTGVHPGGPADRAGLRAGDLITEVNKRRIQDVRGFRAAVESNGRDKATLLRFERRGESRYVAVDPS